MIKELQLWVDKAAQQTSPIHAVYFDGDTPTALEVNGIFQKQSPQKKLQQMKLDWIENAREDLLLKSPSGGSTFIEEVPSQITYTHF